MEFIAHFIGNMICFPVQQKNNISSELYQVWMVHGSTVERLQNQTKEINLGEIEMEDGGNQIKDDRKKRVKMKMKIEEN